MKNKITTILALASISVLAQPTGTPPAYAGNPNQAVTNANFAWYRGGNNLGGQAGPNNIFGTMWNSPIYHYTDGLQRMTLHGTNNNNGGSGDGALVINHDPNLPAIPNSLFNIGDDTPFASSWPWMRIGMSCMSKYDGAYFGLKVEDDDRSDAVIAFGNDVSGPVGPDVLRFIFTRNQSEIARFAPNGGNGFGNFYAYGMNTEPVRRLEILDADPTGFGNSNAPAPQDFVCKLLRS